MTSSAVVSNASPLIAFAQIERLDLLEELFGTICIPPAVTREIAPTIKAPPPWLAQCELSQRLGARVLASSLGPGESEAISLALELDARWVILDERRGRRLAQAMGLTVLGTLGILSAAKDKGLITGVKPHLDTLMSCGFHVATDLHERVLRDAGEK